LETEEDWLYPLRAGGQEYLTSGTRGHSLPLVLLGWDGETSSVDPEGRQLQCYQDLDPCLFYDHDSPIMTIRRGYQRVGDEWRASSEQELEAPFAGTVYGAGGDDVVIVDVDRLAWLDSSAGSIETVATFPERRLTGWKLPTDESPGWLFAQSSGGDRAILLETAPLELDTQWQSIGEVSDSVGLNLAIQRERGWTVISDTQDGSYRIRDAVDGEMTLVGESADPAWEEVASLYANGRQALEDNRLASVVSCASGTCSLVQADLSDATLEVLAEVTLPERDWMRVLGVRPLGCGSVDAFIASGTRGGSIAYWIIRLIDERMP
jgi:hypothetical protein